MIRKRSKKPEWQIKIAEERIEILFKLAERELEKHPERSRRYIELARKIGMRYNIRLSKEKKANFCKHCNTLLYIGKTCEEIESKLPNIRLIKCLNCGKIKKIPK